MSYLMMKIGQNCLKFKSCSLEKILHQKAVEVSEMAYTRSSRHPEKYMSNDNTSIPTLGLRCTRIDILSLTGVFFSDGDLEQVYKWPKITIFQRKFAISGSFDGKLAEHW